jgi:signal transduction histidine kinase
MSDAFSAMAKDASAGVVGAATAGGLPVVQADPVRLRQILLNLLSNAARFTQAGRITLGAEAAGGQLHLWVSDTGVGIPAEVVANIFTNRL